MKEKTYTTQNRQSFKREAKYYLQEKMINGLYEQIRY